MHINNSIHNYNDVVECYEFRLILSFCLSTTSPLLAIKIDTGIEEVGQQTNKRERIII